MLKSFAGQKGPKVRSDCYIQIIKKKSGGIKLKLNSKVLSMYGANITDQIFEMCRFFNLRHADIFIEDSGALPFTIAARFELAIKRLEPELKCEYLPEFNKKNIYNIKYINGTRASIPRHLTKQRLRLYCYNPKT